MRQCFDRQPFILVGIIEADYSRWRSPCSFIHLNVVKALEQVDRWVSAELKLFTQLNFLCAVDLRELNSRPMHHSSCLYNQSTVRLWPSAHIGSIYTSSYSRANLLQLGNQGRTKPMTTVSLSSTKPLNVLLLRSCTRLIVVRSIAATASIAGASCGNKYMTTRGNMFVDKLKRI